jgi:predicted P-loop ATPase
VPDFHPFKDYLEHLPPWDGETDYIRTLAKSVKVKGDEKEQDFFCYFLRKWLVAMVVGWIDKKEVNHLVLVLIGPQGSYKTTWFNALIPPELQAYFHTKINAMRMAKDDLIALAKYALVCCEELDTMSQRELNNLKASITTSSIDERAAYARYSERRKHIASFCGTGNNVQFLTDTTGNRRWLPFEIERITSPRVKPFNYEGIYAQAYALYKSDFKYWLEDDDNERLTVHNETFKVSNAAEELVLSYFNEPTEDHVGEFLTTSEALQMINCNTAHQLNVIQLGRAFSSLGFRSVTYKRRRGFLLVPKTEDARRIERNMFAYKAVWGNNTSNDTDDTDVT